MNTVDRYFEYVRSHCGSPDGGTASSYKTALDKLTSVFMANKPEWAPVADVWSMKDPRVIMELYEHVKDEQKLFKGNKGIFLPYSGHGESYYKKGWCSAALRFFAQFRTSEGYAPLFDAALKSSNDGWEVAKAVKKIKLNKLDGFLPDDIDVTTKEGKEILSMAKQRVGQDHFRKWILEIYRGKCCVTGLDIAEILRASHIVAWSVDKNNRMNPSNGLCLSATYDAAFDRHLITFDDDYRMVLSKSLRDHCTAEVHKKYFLDFEGKRIMLPIKFVPDKILLEKHRNNLLA